MLSITRLSHIYPNGVVALRGIDLHVPRGLFGLLGPNGAGKSTLMRIIATLQEPTAGRLTFDGIDILADPMGLRRVLGYLPQEFGVYPRVSAEEMLTYLARLKGVMAKAERREMVAALLQKANLYEHRKVTLSTFSLGMRQRFGIAQALIGDPRLIIVDEPTAGLDPMERNRFHSLLAEIGQRVVVLLSTHIVEDVAELCPRMAVIAEGRIILEGAPRALIDHLRGRVWRRAVDDGQTAAWQRSHKVLATRLSAGRSIIHVLSPSRPDPTFDPAAPDLEDVYFAALADSQPWSGGKSPRV